MNTVIIRGYVTRDSFTHSIGKNQLQCLNFTIAQNVSFRNERGNLEQKVMFFDVTIYGNYAKAIGSLQKGTLVYVQGKLNQESWEKDGQRHSKVSIIAKKIYVNPPARQHNQPNYHNQAANTNHQNPRNETKLSPQEIEEILEQDTQGAHNEQHN